MTRKLKLAVLAGTLGVSTLAFAGMHLVTTLAGCSSAFKHDRGSYNACVACIKSKGKFKEHAAKKYWACER